MTPEDGILDGRTPQPPWPALRDVRLWAGTAAAAGVASAAAAAWRLLAPGPAPAWAGVAAASSAWLTLALPLLPRTARWAARGGTEPPVLPLVWAAALSPPQYGRGIIAFVWTAALLLWVWSAMRLFGRTLRGDPPPGGGPAPKWRTAPLRSATETACGLVGAAAAVLALLVAAARAALVRSARAEGCHIVGPVDATWWTTAGPFVALCLLAAAAWPVHPAPLQGVGLRSLVVGLVGRLGAPSVPRAAGSGGPAAIIVLAVCVAAGIAAWPVRAIARRQGSAPRRQLSAGALEEPPTWRMRWRMFWERWLARLLRRPVRQPLRHGTWRPVMPPTGPERVAAAAVPARPSGERARVRAAYGGFLRAAASSGLARSPAHTPRRYLGFMLDRAMQARVPLQSLTAAYEDARYSDHAVPGDAAEAAELDARAAAAALAFEARRRLLRGAAPATTPGLRWTPPRGVRRRGGGE